MTIGVNTYSEHEESSEDETTTVDFWFKPCELEQFECL